MGKYKAEITREDFENFTEYYNADKTRAEKLLDGLSGLTSEEWETVKEMFNCDFMGRAEWRNIFSLEDEDNQKLQVLVNYCADNNLMWHVDRTIEDYIFVSFSGNKMFWDKKFCTLIEMPDYDALTLGEIRAKLGSGMSGASLPAELNAISIASVNEEKSRICSKEDELKKLKDDISYARTEELKKMEEEIRKLEDIMRARKKELQAELAAKLAAMNEEKEKLNNQIYMLESEIYSIRSYSGETIELRRVRDGKPADSDTPLIVNQKMMYLDEDLARIISIYQKEISEEYQLFEEAVKYNDDVFDSFCPQERCITFFRLSKNATYRWFNAERMMYKTEELIHGKKIGFILRDGERAYMGWMDERWRINENGKAELVTFTENLMYLPEKQGTHSDLDDAKYGLKSDSRNDMLSRVFAMFVVQGILDNKGLLCFPEKVNITKPGKYIVYNFADGWLMDDRFGDFATLVDNLNKRTKVKDQILVCYSKWHCEGRGEADRAHDCEVPEGVNRVNFLEADEYGHCSIYVSAKKRYSNKGATANVKVRKNEYINITYMNSIWLSYYVQTKKMGTYAEDYAKMVKHFKRAVEILRDREAEEMSYIKKYFPEADLIPEWQIKLSHWKLNHNIRFINDFQAKRIAKYLQEGNFEENKNLFVKEEFYNIEATYGGMYTRTKFGWVSGWDKNKDAGEFEKGSPYYMQAFYVPELKKSSWLSEEDKEENRIKIAAALPKLEAFVPERIKQDEKKLSLVNKYVSDFLDEHGVSVSDLPECPFGLTFNGGKLGFMNLESLEKENRSMFFNLADETGHYPEHILRSECWKVAYYDYVHKQYDKLLHDVKMVLHERFMSDTACLRVELQNE